MPKKSSLKYSFHLSKLCSPSSLYFYISIIALLFMAIQNIIDKDDSFCIGTFRCNIGNKLFVFLFHIIYIVFWTFVLDLMCKAGYNEISWFIVLIPFLLFFIFFGMVMYNQNIQNIQNATKTI